MAKNSKNIFLFFSRPSASFSCIITIYIDQISKNRFLGRFGTVRPKSRKTGFFGKNPAGSTFFEYCPPTSGQKSGKSLEPFSRNFRLTTIFGPFWAILGHFGTVWPKIQKTGFFGRNPALSVFIINGPQTSDQKSEKSLEPFSGKSGINTEPE